MKPLLYSILFSCLLGFNSVWADAYNFLAKWGEFPPDNAAGHFNYALSIAVSAPDINGEVFVYVSDHRNHRVQMFTSNGVFVRAFGTYGSGNDNLKEPIGVTVDSQGRLYIADSKNNRIQRVFFNPITLTESWSSLNLTPSTPCPNPNDLPVHPVNVAVDASGRIYVVKVGCNGSNNSVEIFQSFNSTSPSTLPSISHPWDIAVYNDPTNLNVTYVYVTDFMPSYIAGAISQIKRFKLYSGSDPTEITPPLGEHGTGDLQFIGGLDNAINGGIAVDSNNYIYVADSGNTRVQKIKINGETGEFITKWGTPGVNDTNNGKFSDLTDVAVDANGNVYTSDRKNYFHVQKFGPIATSGCSLATPCLNPSIEQSRRLFEKVAQFLPHIFPLQTATTIETINFSKSIVAYLQYFFPHIPEYSNITGLATFQGGFWYALGNNWQRYSSLDEMNQQICKNTCWNP